MWLAFFLFLCGLWKFLVAHKEAKWPTLRNPDFRLTDIKALIQAKKYWSTIAELVSVLITLSYCVSLPEFVEEDWCCSIHQASPDWRKSKHSLEATEPDKIKLFSHFYYKMLLFKFSSTCGTQRISPLNQQDPVRLTVIKAKQVFN